MLKRSAAAVAAGGLLLGAAACSDDDDSDTTSTTDATAGAVDDLDGADGGADATDGAEGGADATDATDATDGAEGGADATDGAEGDDAEGAGNGADGELSEGLAAAYEEMGGETGELGALQNVESGDAGTLATFDNGWLTESADGTVTPLIGEIGNTWVTDGGLENELGLPTAPETGDAATGWQQTFENGTLSWVNDGAGNWSADIQPGQ